jgi:hypothetical protein
MKRALYLLAATAALAGPAAAGDLLYPGGTLLTETVAGKPYWSVQADCAGVYGAASAYLAETGDTAGSAKAKAMGESFYKDAVDRVMKDRHIARRAAIDTLSPTVIKGRGQALDLLRAEGDGPQSKWNYARSACLDVRDAYRAH